MKRLALRIRTWSFAGFLLAMAILAVASGALWSDKRDMWDRATLAADNVRVTLQSDMARALRLYDMALMGAAEAIRTPGFKRAGPALRQRLLFSRIDTLEYLGSMLVLDPAGNVIHDSLDEDTHGVNFADREYFAVHRDNYDRGLFLSKPFESRLRGGRH